MSSATLKPILRSSSSSSSISSSKSSLSISPLKSLRRPQLFSPLFLLPIQTSRTAVFLKRPRRQCQFDQIIMLSDGSSYRQRTTSPRGVVRYQEDNRNHPMWNPRDYRLFMVEDDEAGRLKAFRNRYGKGFDSDATRELEIETARKLEEKEGSVGLVDQVRKEQDEEDSLFGMIAENFDESKLILKGKITKKAKEKKQEAKGKKK